MGQCLRKLSNLLEETEPAPHSFKASIRAKETAKATHKGNLLLTDNEILFYENKKPDPLYQWELQFVRKYGVEKKIFSIHVGTRTKTGEGQFLFRCRQAEQLGKEIEARISVMASQSKGYVKCSSSSTSSRNNPPKSTGTACGVPTNAMELDGPQEPYVNIYIPKLTEDDKEQALCTDDLYINVQSPKMPAHSAKQSDAAEEANTTQSYIVLEQNPTGSMSPRLAGTTESQRPEPQEINYTEIDIEMTKAVIASQKPIT